MEAVTVATLTSTVGSFLTAALGWVGDVANTVVSDPLLTLMVICLPVAGFGIGAVRRIMGL